MDTKTEAALEKAEAERDWAVRVLKQVREDVGHDAVYEASYLMENGNYEQQDQADSVLRLWAKVDAVISEISK